MIYLASPYSHSDKLIVKNRFLLVEQCCAYLIRKGYFVWSPIVHCHEMATKYEMPTDAQFWKDYNFDFIRRADAVYVLKIDGWDKSIGVGMEIDLANKIGITVQFVDPEGEII